MYLGVDIGGTKTLVAAIDISGKITEHTKFPTAHDYLQFLDDLAKTVDSLTTKKFKAAGAAIPAVEFNRINGVAASFGNLPWRDVAIKSDLRDLLKCPVVIENDAKLAALSEAMLLKDSYRRVLYVTISTGIGYGLVVDGEIDTSIGDGGGRTMVYTFHGKNMAWEDFASGRAIVARFGHKAADLDDEATWKVIAHDLSRGLIELIAVTEPEVIVIGGSVGAHLNKYKAFLRSELERYAMPLVPLPRIIEAQRPVEAVIYGCYDLARQTYGKTSTAASN